MKSTRNKIAGLLVLVMGLSFSPGVFADKGQEDPAFLKLLTESSSALQAANSPLAVGMKAFADEETQEAADEAKGIKEPERSEAEKMTRRQAHLKLLQDSAAALIATHPDLAAELTKTADEKAKKIAEKEKELAAKNTAPAL